MRRSSGGLSWPIAIACALIATGCESGSGDTTPSASEAGSGDDAAAADTSPRSDAASDATVDATPDVEADAATDVAPDDATEDATDDATDDAIADALVDAPYAPPDAVVVPPLPAFDAGVLPKNDAGLPILSTGTGLQLGLADGPRGPVNALAGCAGLISGCYQPGVRSLDACVLSMPKCATGEPWNESAACCPASCVTRYEAARVAGTPPQAAAYTVLFKSPRCIPGLDDALGGKP